MSMNCLLLLSVDLPGVVVDSDIQLSGTIAQFGRTGLISEVANALVAIKGLFGSLLRRHDRKSERT
jgi:uncharacterized protein